MLFFSVFIISVPVVERTPDNVAVIYIIHVHMIFFPFLLFQFSPSHHPWILLQRCRKFMTGVTDSDKVIDNMLTDSGENQFLIWYILGTWRQYLILTGQYHSTVMAMLFI